MPIEQHDEFIKQMQALGYEADSEGICWGFIMMWIRSVLSDEEEKFFDRVDLILKTEKLKQKTRRAKKKHGKNLSSKDQSLIDISAFFEGVELHFQPENYRELTHIPLHQQDEITISSYIESDAIKRSCGIEKIYFENNIYTESELQNYLDGLRNIFVKLDATKKMAMSFSTFGHAMGLLYIPELDAWQFVDINHLPFELIPSGEIGSRLFDLLEVEGFMEFSTNLYLTADHPKKHDLQQQLNSFKKNHPITDDLATRKTDEGVTLLHLAAAENDVELVEKILKFDMVNINERDEADNSPLEVAISRNNSEIVDMLIRAGAELSQPDQNGKTPIHYAADYDYPDIIWLLTTIGNVDIDLRDTKGSTAAHFAAECDSPKTIDLLCTLGANFNLQDHQGQTPLLLAVKDNNTAIIKLLTKHNANCLLSDNGGNSPLSVAIEKQAWNSVVFMLLNTPSDVFLPTEISKNLTKYKNELTGAVVNYLKNDTTNRYEKDLLIKDILQERNHLGKILNISSSNNLSALSIFQRGSKRKQQNKEEESDLLYPQELENLPLTATVSKLKKQKN